MKKGSSAAQKNLALMKKLTDKREKSKKLLQVENE